MSIHNEINLHIFSLLRQRFQEIYHHLLLSEYIKGCPLCNIYENTSIKGGRFSSNMELEKENINIRIWLFLSMGRQSAKWNKTHRRRIAMLAVSILSIKVVPQTEGVERVNEVSR